MLSADFIVVGAGSAGAVIARRLVDSGASVLLLEAGGPDTSPAIHDPARLFELWDAPEDWGYRTVPQAHAHRRELHWPRGKVIGGSSALNGMIYVRGSAADYDHWAYLGNAGWSYADVLPLFKRAEDYDRGPSEHRGTGGPLHVMSRYEPDEIHHAIVAAAQEVGVPFNPDHNGAELAGVGYMQYTVKEGRRQSASVAFLTPVLADPKLTVLTSARARRLLFERTRCVGVELVHDGATASAHAAREVIVCAGTIESPRLLMLSGIGDSAELRALGLEVLVDLPGVGRNLHDHTLCPVIMSTASPLMPLAPGLPPMQSHLFWHSRPGLLVPDIQPLHFSLPLYEPWMEGPPHGYTLMAGAIRPASRGTVRLRSADPEDPPLLDPAYLACGADLEALVAAVELCREIARASPLAEWGSREVYPGDGARSPADVRDYVRKTVITYHHQAGTCSMGIDAWAVVDPELRVYGVEGLRVADASIMPTVTSGNTNAPTIMIGERAADLALSRG